MRFLRKLTFVLVTTMAAAGWSGSASADPLVLPPCVPSVTCLVFGDFDVYSLALVNGIFKPGDFVPNNDSDPFHVKSTPGDIKDGVVFGTGSNGVPVTQNFAGMDDAYRTPSGMGGLPYFSTGLVADPPTLGAANPSFGAGDLPGTWDASVSALRSFLLGGGGGFAPFFNLNETGDNDDLAGNDLLIWLHVWLQDVENPLAQKDYYLTGDLAASMMGAPGGPDPTSASGTDSMSMTFDPRWAYVHGRICVNGTDFLHLGGCNTNGYIDPMGSQSVNQNLGAATAAFAIFNQELSNLILNANSGYEFLHVDWRMARLNNGFEQAFLLADTSVTQVPEPGMLWIWGAFLIAISAFGRRRRAR